MPHDKTSISLLRLITNDFKANPFFPYRLLKQGDAQTLGAYLWPRRFRLRDHSGDEERLFEVEPGSQVLAHCRWQPDRAEQPTLVMWHGMEGSTASAYMLTTADKMFRSGFNVVRVNFRNCGGTEHLSPTLYHGGLTGDLRAGAGEPVAPGRLVRIFFAAFFLGR